MQTMNIAVPVTRDVSVWSAGMKFSLFMKSLLPIYPTLLGDVRSENDAVVAKWWRLRGLPILSPCPIL